MGQNAFRFVFLRALRTAHITRGTPTKSFIAWCGLGGIMPQHHRAGLVCGVAVPSTPSSTGVPFAVFALPRSGFIGCGSPESWAGSDPTPLKGTRSHRAPRGGFPTLVRDACAFTLPTPRQSQYAGVCNPAGLSLGVRVYGLTRMNEGRPALPALVLFSVRCACSSPCMEPAPASPLTPLSPHLPWSEFPALDVCGSHQRVVQGGYGALIHPPHASMWSTFVLSPTTTLPNA